VIQINYSDGTVQTACLTFQEGITDWQYNSIAVVPKYPEKTISTMKVFCCYYNEVNTAYFDNISLVEEPAETYTYDDNGNVIAVNAAGNGEETYSYNSTTQNLMSVATAGSGTYTYAYGNTNNTHLVTKVTNDTVSMGITYDSLGEATQTKLTNTSDSTYMTSSAAYSNGLLTSVTDNTGATTSYTYNNRQISAEKNANGVTVNTTYNALALPSLTYQSGKISLNYTYTNGLISQIQKGGYFSGNSTKQLQSYNFTYDYFGNRTNIAVGTRTLASYAYGSNDGNLSTLTYGNGDSVKYSYDSLDRVKKVEYSKSGDSYEYSYDGNDQLAVVVDNQTGDTYHYTYDSLGRLIYSNIVSNGAIGLYTSHEYDTSNRIVAQSWQIGSDKFTEQYTYSSTDGTLTEMTTGGIPNSYSYDNLKRLSHRINSVMRVGYSYVTSGNKTTSQVSSIGITTLSGSSIATLGYSYDALGNITKVTNTAGSTETYTYDTQNQLTAATIGSTSYAYTYDTYGNIRTATRGSTTHTYTYGDNEWLDLLTAYDGNSITYDTIGNPLSYYNGTRWTLTWQNGRQLAKAVKSGRTLSYTYDASGMVSSKTVTSSGSTLQCTYTVLDGKVVREVRGSYIINYSYDENGRPFKISIVTGSATYEGYYVLNLQGDVIKIVDSSGNSLVSYAYDPWGKFTGSSTSTLGEMLLDYNCLTYRGYYYDEYIGMYYLQSRFYDPNIGRFINADAADYADLAAVSLSETNLFAYCGNNPVACKDPTGEFLLDGLSVVAAAGIAGVIAGGIWGGISAAMTGGDFYAIIGGMAFGAATGGLAGAACALTSVSVGLRVLCGATLGVINYCYTTDVEDSTASGFITSAVLGGATMAIGVALPSVSSIPINFAGTYLLSGVSSVGTSIVNTIASTSKSKSKKASNVTSAGSAVHNMHRSFSRGLRHVTYVNSGKTAGIQLSHQYSKVSLMYG
jgi:RHS repeat-associated protein